MKILVVNNEREDFSGRAAAWEGHALSFSAHGFEAAVQGLWDPRARVRINRGILDDLVAGAHLADAVYCEAPEALLLWYVMSRRGLKPAPFVMEDEDLLHRVRRVARWIRDTYGEDPLEEFLAVRANVWLHHAPAHRTAYRDAGIAANRLHYMPCSSFMLSIVRPDLYRKIRSPRPWAAPCGARFRGRVVAAGANRRDFATFCNAMRDLPYKGTIISGAPFSGPVPRHVEVLGFVPLEQYLCALGAARLVAAPLSDPDLTGGDNTITFAMAQGTPVVASRTLGTAPLMQHGVSGLLVPVGDADALRDAIITVMEIPEAHRALSRHARAAERRIAAVNRSVLLKAFSQAARGPL